MGFWPLAFVLLRAYSMGGGTYTGIEAVSNGVTMLREPRVKTGKHTMFLMAASLAFTAGGILFGYLLVGARAHEGKTMNWVLFDALFGHWKVGGIAVGTALVLTLLVAEAALLFVAAQAGFLDGPRVLGNMAVDSWVPHRFSQLSDRLVTKNGVFLMGLAAIAALLYTRGDITMLVVMYSINVFLTFSLTELGMTRHWIVERKEPRWKQPARDPRHRPRPVRDDPLRHPLREVRGGRLDDVARDERDDLRLLPHPAALRERAAGPQASRRRPRARPARPGRGERASSSWTTSSRPRSSPWTGSPATGSTRS